MAKDSKKGGYSAERPSGSPPKGGVKMGGAGGALGRLEKSGKGEKGK